VENAELDNKFTVLENTGAITYQKRSEQKTQDNALQTCILWIAGVRWKSSENKKSAHLTIAERCTPTN